MILGLTGGIGSGKTTASKFFEKMGLEVIDADKIAREILDIEEVKKEIEICFGEEAILSSGEVNRGYIKECIFSDDNMRYKLNAIVHPKVEKIFKDIYEKEKEDANNNKKHLTIKIFDIPLLFEAKLEKYCDKVLVIYLEEKLQLQRIIDRDKMKEELGKKIIKSQMSVKEKLERADYIIENNKGIEEFYKELRDIIGEIKKGGGI